MNNMSEAVEFVNQLLDFGVELQEALDNAATSFEVDIVELQIAHSNFMMEVH